MADVKTRRGAQLNTDHVLLTADIRLKPARNYYRRQHRKRNLNLTKLEEQETREGLMEDIRRETPSMDKIRKACEERLGYINYERASHITDRTWDLISLRNAFKARTLDYQEGAVAAELSAMNRNIKKCARADKRNHLKQISEAAEMASRRGDIATVHRCVRSLTGAKGANPGGLRDGSGGIVMDEDRQMAIWRSHFQNGEQTAADSTTHLAISAGRGESSGCPSLQEIESAIRKLKSGKAAGLDGIPAEIFKLDPEYFAHILHAELMQIWATGVVPDAWKEGIIIKLPKKGDLSQCENWRGITILNTRMKVLAIILHDRVFSKIDGQMREEQAGFRGGRNCLDHIMAVRSLFEQATEHRSPLYAVFIDFKRAFDTVHHSAIWRAMEEAGVHPKDIQITAAMYRGAESRVAHGGALSDPIPLTRGVRQGCPLSPLLFVLTLDNALKKALVRPRGIQLGPFECVESLEYADDEVLIAETPAQLGAKLEKVVEETGKIGLECNTKKTRVMRTPDSQEVHLTVAGEAIKEVDRYTYLGAVITRTGGALEDAQARVNAARWQFSRLQRVWGSTQISRNTKMKLLSSGVLPCALYGSESWGPKEAVDVAQVFINKCLRKICRIYWPETITNEELWRKTGTRPAAEQIERRRWGYIGHAARRRGQSVRLLQWRPSVKRKPGRPRMTLRECVERGLQREGLTWRTLYGAADNRDDWRRRINCICSETPQME